MCLSTAYAGSKSEDNAIMENVMKINCSGENVILTDLMEKSYSFNAVLKEANLVDGYVILDLKG